MSGEFNNIGLHQCQLYLCSALPMSAAATQVVPPSEAWRSFWHHLGAVVIKLALNLPLASKASYLLAPRTGGAPWLFCGPDDWMAGTRSGCLPWDGQRREAVPSCVILSPCIFLSFTLSLLKLDEDSRKSHYTSWEAVTTELETSVFLITGAENFPRASVLASQICLSRTGLCDSQLPHHKPRAHSREEATWYLKCIPLCFGTEAENRHLPEGDLSVHQARMQPHYNWSQNLSDRPVSARSRWGQKSWWITGTYT